MREGIKDMIFQLNSNPKNLTLILGELSFNIVHG